MSLLIRLFPREWRRRYGDEITDLLASSNHPWRDRADVLAAAIAARAERITAVRNVRLTAAALVVLGVLGGFWATPRLSDGPREIPGHWWSTLAVLPAVIGLGLAVAAWIHAGSRRSKRHSGP